MRQKISEERKTKPNWIKTPERQNKNMIKATMKKPRQLFHPSELEGLGVKFSEVKDK